MLNEIKRLENFRSMDSHGVRRQPQHQEFKEGYFNPHTHIECDLKLIKSNLEGLHFNPRTHIECDSENTRNKVI